MQVLLVCATCHPAVPILQSGKLALRKINTRLVQGHPFGRWPVWGPKPVSLGSQRQRVAIWLPSSKEGRSGQRESARPWSCRSEAGWAPLLGAAEAVSAPG